MCRYTNPQSSFETALVFPVALRASKLKRCPNKATGYTPADDCRIMSNIDDKRNQTGLADPERVELSLRSGVLRTSGNMPRPRSTLRNGGRSLCILTRYPKREKSDQSGLKERLNRWDGRKPPSYHGRERNARSCVSRLPERRHRLWVSHWIQWPRFSGFGRAV